MTGVLPVISAGEDIQSSDALGVITVAAMQEIAYPFIPHIAKSLQHVPPLPFLAQRVVDGVKRH